MRTKLTRTLSTIALLALVCAVALAGCGSSSKKPSATSHANAMIAFSECMRAHSTPNFPDPSGGDLNLNGTGINPQAPSFRAARTTCSKLLPGGGPSTHATGQQINQATQTAECMRKHGVTGYPDPIITATPPNINPADYSEASYGNGIFTGIPRSINVNSPAFKAAAKTCNFG